jgi:hypothetical protein
LNGEAWRAALAASPALAALTNGRPSPSLPSSSACVSVPVAASLAASTGSSGSSLARAKSFAVPVAITASGTPRRPASSAAGPIVPSPPGHGHALRPCGGDALELVRLAAEDLDLRSGLAHGGGERLGVEPAPRLRVGREGDAHGA